MASSEAKRQAVLGFIILLLAVFTVYQAYQDGQDKEARDECFQDKFRELSVALNARADISARETQANKMVLLAFTAAARNAPKPGEPPPTPKEQQEQQQHLIHVLDRYGKIIDQVEKDRAAHPLPPYPVGVCK